MRIAIVLFLLAGCAVDQSAAGCLMRRDAARAVCDALCDRCAGFAPGCADECAAVVCAGQNCSVCVADEVRADGCAWALRQSACGDELPEACAGALR